ncbi:hypothetical protein ACFL6C_09540 [Myxococcota bacterium]
MRTILVSVAIALLSMAAYSCGSDCWTGNSCVCSGDSCTESCDDGNCSFTCTDDATCDFSCAGGGCSLECSGAASCTMDCAGNGCGMNCTSTDTCELTACSSNCALNCGGAATCNSSCDLMAGCATVP